MNWQRLLIDWPLFAQGFVRTLLISGLGLIFTLVIGVVLGMILCSRAKFLHLIIRGYMSLFQNTPLVMQIFIFYNVLPRVGIVWDTFSIGVIGLALYTGAYATDIVASAILAVPFGQMEAAASQGFGFIGSMFRVVLPQAIKIGLPPMTNQAVNLIKNSSVMAVIAGGELMYVANSWGYDKIIYGPTFVVTGLLYLIICLPISLLARKLEKRSMSNG